MELLSKFKSFLLSQAKPASFVTTKNYLSDISRFIKWVESRFNHFSPELITPEIIEEFRKSSKGAASSMERNLSSLRKFFHFLELEGLISESPFSSEAGSRSAREQPDPYRLKAFKDYLYVYNASSLTIKNYLSDIKSFIKWLEKVTVPANQWEVKDENLLSKIQTNLIEEYKNRLLKTSAPRTINRKLSSLRKYLAWATEAGFIEAERFGRQSHLLGDARLSNISIKGNLRSLSEIQQSSSIKGKIEPASSFSSPKSGLPPRAHEYSRFPPLRLVQKTFHGLEFVFDLLTVAPLASLIKKAELLLWKARGKPIFEAVKRQKEMVKNLPKDFFAPLSISTRYLSFHKKLLYHIRYTRPKWYLIYHRYSFTHYLHIAILVLAMSLIGFNLYTNFFYKPASNILGITNPKSPPRLLSFQGRLTDASDNIITAKTDLRFGIYDSLTGTGSGLLWQEVQSVTPDSDGVFAVLLGSKSSFQQSLFAEHAGLWLGVAVGQTAELTPRQQLATVAYAENAETLQGLPPITDSSAGQSNVVLALDSSGNLTIGGTATPTFQATGGQFTLSGNPLLLTTVSGTNGDIIASPSGLGKIDLNKPIRNLSNNNNISTAVGAVEFDDLVAILATSSGQSAFTVDQNSTGPILSASSSGTAKFTVANSGATTIADDLAVNGGDITSTQTTFNLLNSTVTTLNVGGAATTINLGATSGTTTTANSLTILGNTTLGDTASDTITLTGAVNSNVLPDANNSRNLGSSSLRWNTVYGTNGDFTNIAGTVTGGSTTSSSWTVNSDNATANAEVGSLAFETGTATFNDVLQWNASGDAGRISGFDNTNLFNFPVGIFSQVSGANQSFTSGTLFKYGQPAAHAITQSAAFIGTDYDFSTNITVPNSASGNQTGFKTTLKDGGASATAIGFQTAGTLDYGIDLGGTIGTAEIRLSNAETIDNKTDGKVKVTATNLDLSGTAYQINGSSGSTISACGATQYISSMAVTGGIVTAVGSCVTSTTAWSALTDPTGNLALAMGANTTTFTWNAATGASTNLFNLIDTASNTGTGYLLNVGTASSSNLKPLQVQARGTTIIDTTAAGAITVNAATSATTPITIKGATSQSVDLLQLKTSLDAVIAKVDQLGNITGNTLTSTVSTGTAPLTVSSTTQVANLYVASSDQPQPNLVLNSDFGRRNKWMTFMPEVFADTSGWTALVGSLGTVASNTLTAGTASAEWIVAAGLTTWRDGRFSAQGKLTADVDSSGFGVLKIADADNFVEAQIQGGASDTFRIIKEIAGVRTQVASVAYASTLNNWYWVELEAQGTTYIAKLYSSGASAVAKSSATLVATLTGTISDAGIVTGRIGLRHDPGMSTATQWGGLSTGDGGVYVEGWGPESWTVELNGTKGGQAIGFDETADSGPIEKQWTMRAYIPATSRNIEVYQDTPDGSVLASTSYVSSMYLKTSGKGGSGSLVRLQFQRMNSALTQQGSTTVDDAGETSWTRVNSGAITTETGTRRARIRAHINASGTATGTGLFLLPQLEQGGVATPWRNAPADDGPITWRLYSNAATNLSTTDTTGATEAEPRDLAGNVFLPWDAAVSARMEFLWRNEVTGNQGYAQIVENGNSMADSGTTVPFVEDMAVSGEYQQFSGTLVKGLAAGKHRIAIRWGTNAGTQSIFRDLARTPTLTITVTRGKFDLAEEYSVNDTTIEAGDVVQLASNNSQVASTIERSIGGYNPVVLGIVSTAPGITLASTVELNGYREKPNLRPVALQGRVPVKVTNENGPIHRGDILTSSNTKPGYAMKATRAGRSIGIAMEDFSPSSNSQVASSNEFQTGKVMTFVNLSFYDPDVYLTDSGSFVINKVSEQPIANLTSDGVASSEQISSFAKASEGQAKYIIQNTSGETLSRIGAYKDLFVANLKVGSLDVSEIKNFGKVCVQSESSEDFGLIKNVCSQTTVEKLVEQGTYAVKTAAGEVVTGGQIIGEAVIGTVRAGLVETQELIADTVLVNNKIISPIAEIATVRTDTITPLSSEKVVIKLEDHSATPSATSVPKLEVQNASGSAVASVDDAGNANFSGQLSSKELNTEEASISGTLRTKNLIAENIESQVAGIKSLISGLSSEEASTSASPIDIASYSGQLANVDTLNAQVGTFMQGLFAVGPTSLSDATVFGQLSVGTTLTLADNSINVLGTDLQIQPLGQGGISFLAGKIYIDTFGNLNIEGNATVKGTLFAKLISPIPDSDLVIRLPNSDFRIQNASGSAVFRVDNKGQVTASKLNLELVEPVFALSESELIATGSAGVATISANFKEVTVLNKLVTDKSLIYVTPIGTASAQTPYLLRQSREDEAFDSKGSFTVGTQNLNTEPFFFNWLIIN